MRDEYLTIAELASRLKLSRKTIQNKMARGIFRQGIHFYRPKGMGPRFRWSQVEAWLEGKDDSDEGTIPMAKGYRMKRTLPAADQARINRKNGLQGSR